MNNNLLKMLLKSKIAKTKDKKEFIDELLRYLNKENQKALKNALDELFLMIATRKDDPNLQTLIQNKINALELNIPNLDYEMIYEKFADNALPKDRQNVAFSFDEIDIRSLEVMRKNFYWMKNEYNEKVSNELKSITEKVFNGEIPRADMASALKEQFKGVLSANTSYFEGVSDHIISQMQNIARVNQASKYYATHYKVVARIDSRTSECCRSMNGRIIPASHIEAQSGAIQNAKNIAEKKSAAIWRSEPFYGKILPKNFGLPPYHFRCRTEIVPVWIDEEEVGGVVMRNTSPLNQDEVIKHIDKTGVERVLSKDNYFGSGNHSKPLHKKAPKSDIIKALNSIERVAVNNKNPNRLNAMSQNGYFLVFDGVELVTIYKPTDSLEKYFKRSSVLTQGEIIKSNIFTRWFK